MTVMVAQRFPNAAQPVAEDSPAGAYLADDSPILRALDDQRQQIDAKLSKWLSDAQARVPTASRQRGQGSEAEQLGAINARWFAQLAGGPHRAEWLQLEQRVADVLARESKDLRLLPRLVEASAYADGFDGLADALDLAATLADRYWDTIHPNEDDAGMFDELRDTRRQALAWFGEPKDGLPYVVTAIPLDATPDGKRVTLRHLFAAARRFAGWPTEEQVRAVIKRTPAETLKQTQAAIARCLKSVEQLDEVFAAKLGEPMLARVQTHLRQCYSLITDVAADPVEAVTQTSLQSPIARLEIVQDAARRAASPREHCLVQIDAVDACLAAGLYWFALPVLDSVMAEIDEHKLAEWEAPDLIRRVTALVERCRESAAAAGHRSAALDRLVSRAGAIRSDHARAGGER
jgi:ImpA, N-terminal, type VI secretion system/Type VI secretion, EvfE, EvfF, ImpA, BimE, VC_A0119, VasJ